MFQFPAFASYTYVFRSKYHPITDGGFPHSEISGSKPVSGSPKLIAAFRVLHRLPIPRHPPSALSSLTISLIKSLTQLLYIAKKVLSCSCRPPVLHEDHAILYVLTADISILITSLYIFTLLFNYQRSETTTETWSPCEDLMRLKPSKTLIFKVKGLRSKVKGF